MSNVVAFPLQPIDLDRVRTEGDEPCIVLVLPVVWIERDGGTPGDGDRLSRETNASSDT